MLLAALGALLLPVLPGGSHAAIVMESNGRTTGIEAEEAPDASREIAPFERGADVLFGTPLRQKRDEGELEPLPWGITPEVHVPWFPPYGGRPPYPWPQPTPRPGGNVKPAPKAP